MRTSMELTKEQRSEIKDFCKENGMTLKGLFLLGYKKIKEGKNAKENT